MLSKIQNSLIDPGVKQIDGRVTVSSVKLVGKRGYGFMVSTNLLVLMTKDVERDASREKGRD